MWKYYKFRSMTEQLDRDMNHIVGSGAEIVSAHFQGGRDWTLICRRLVDDRG